MVRCPLMLFTGGKAARQDVFHAWQLTTRTFRYEPPKCSSASNEWWAVLSAVSFNRDEEQRTPARQDLPQSEEAKKDANPRRYIESVTNQYNATTCQEQTQETESIDTQRFEQYFSMFSDVCVLGVFFPLILSMYET